MAIEEFLTSQDGEVWFECFRVQADLAVYPAAMTPVTKDADPLSRSLGRRQHQLEDKCATLGLRTFLQVYWKKTSQTPDAKRMSTLVSLAAANGHLAIVQMILLQAEDTEKMCQNVSDEVSNEVRVQAIHASILNGHAAVLHSMLESCQNIVSIPKRYALLVAQQGYAETLECLYANNLLGVSRENSIHTDWSDPVILLSERNTRGELGWRYASEVRQKSTLRLHYSPAPPHHRPAPPRYQRLYEAMRNVARRKQSRF
jgi:hypothetical protein